MPIPIVYYSQKEGKSSRQKGAIVMMKKEITRETSSRAVGYELLRKGIPSGLIREYWPGSPWRALWDYVRGVQ